MMNFNEILDAINTKGEIEITETDLGEMPVDNMDAEHIVIHRNGEKIVLNRKNAEPIPYEYKHEYVMPDFAPKVRAILRRAVNGKGTGNILLSGPMGTGKSEFVHELCKEFGMKCFQINGSENLIPADFYGSLSVAVDEKTGTNYTRFDKGALYRAFIEGTKLDANGNQELDAEGEPIVVGKPAVFFLDEFAAMLPEVFLGVFNRVLEIPRDGSPCSRSMVVPSDEGRVVKSHPGMVVFLAGNTVGTGNDDKYTTAYTAQANHMDESTLNRITASQTFQYNLNAERGIIANAFCDDLETERLMKLVADLRNMYRNGEKVSRVVSTRTITSIIRLFRIYKEEGIENPLIESIRDAVYNMLPEKDKAAWSTEISMIYHRDFIGEAAKHSGYVGF